MRGARRDIPIGATFGRWTIVDVAGPWPRRVSARCSCGTASVVRLANLTRGLSKSCGCLSVEITAARSTKHGHAYTGRPSREYIAWASMIERCANPHYTGHHGRGITVCAEWRHDFPAFLAHVGPRPSSQHSIDRIDNDGNYEPGNVRWATRIEQARNRRPYSQWNRVMAR